MKRKNTMQAAPKPPQPTQDIQCPVAKPGELGDAPMSMGERATLWLFPLLLFFAMTLQAGWTSVVLAGAAVVMSIGKAPLRNWRAAWSLPVLGLVCYAVFNGFAAIYAPFGDYAAREFSKILGSVAVGFLVLTRFRKAQSRGLLWGFSGVCAAISLLCIDLAGDGPLYRGFAAVMTWLGNDYSNLQSGNTMDTRLNGIFNNGNLSGSLLALAMLALLYLASSGKKRWERPLACWLLGVCSMGFFLALSRGAILSFAVAALVFLAVAGKGNRLPLFFLMGSTALVTVAFSALCMGSLGQKTLLPMAMTLVCGGVIFLLDWGVGTRLAAKLEGHTKAITVTAAMFLALCVGYGVAALNITGAYTFDSSEFLYRSVALSAGRYTLTAQGNGETALLVYARSQEESLLNTSTQLYNGPLEQAAFTVPVEAKKVYFQLYSAQGNTLDSVTLSDGTVLKLGYPLLPSFVANRLQDSLLTSHSLLLRWQFILDGLKLFAQSPLWGHGLGSSEGLLTSVQPFFYESLYIHNHLVQAMGDMGIFGLGALLTMMLGAAWLLVRRLRRGSDLMAAMLLGCLVMMNLHGLMEITFSVRMYQCAAWFVVAVIAMCYAWDGETEPAGKQMKWMRYGIWTTLAVCWAFLLGFGGLYASHLRVQTLARTQGVNNAAEFMAANAAFVKRDVFDHEQFQINYVGNAVTLDSSLYNGLMRQYAEELRASGTYTACSALAKYYYLPRNELNELFTVSREGIAQEASNKDSWNLQLDFYRTVVLPEMTPEQMEAFVTGVLETRDYLVAYSEGRLEEILLSEQNTTFLEESERVRAEGLSGEVARARLLPFAAVEELAGN